MQIGIRNLGGDPEAFYRLSRERQIDVMAVLQVERMREDPKGNKDWLKDVDQVKGTPEALAFWSELGFGGLADAG